MGYTIWIRQERDKEATDDDHPALFANLEGLDVIAAKAGVPAFSSFVDWTDLEANLSEEDLPESWVSEHERWHAPHEAIPGIRAVIDALNAGANGAIKDRRALIAELEDCLTKLQAIAAQNDSFHFCVVM